MTAYEIVSTILAVASLMVATGMLVVALLAILDKIKSAKNNAYPVCQQDRRLSMIGK